MAEKFPTREECLQFMAKYQMLPNIWEHSILVTEVALVLGEALEAAGIVLSLPLIEAGALLHDIAKSACLRNGGNHALMGAEWLRQAGHPRVAEIIQEHVYLSPRTLEAARILEAEVVNYADKRVMHTKIVPLAVRFADLRVRYGRDAEAITRITALEAQTRRLEDKIFAPLTLTPQDLLDLNNTRRAR